MRGIIIIICTLFFVLAQNVLGGIVVNEIMYDPASGESYNEWIELYNDGIFSVSLENWSICGDAILEGYVSYPDGNISLNTTIVLGPGAYAIITDGGSGTEAYKNFNISNESVALHTSSSSICGFLNNGGGEIVLSDGRMNWSYTYPDIAAEGYSAELTGGAWIQSMEAGGTPGRKNTAVNAEDNITAAEPEGKLSLSIGISPANLSLGQTLNISGNITTTFSNTIQANLTIKVARRINDGWKYSWYIAEDYQTAIANKSYLGDTSGNNFSWKVPDDLISGEYKVLATLQYRLGNDTRYNYGSKEFYVQGLEDLGEHNLTLIDVPAKMRFGGIEKAFVRFDSNNYDFENISFVAYIYSPRWASIDFDDTTLRTRPYNTRVAVKLRSVSRGESVYLAIPLLAKRNCDGDFESGDYKAKVRVYEDGKDLIEKTFGIYISGKNDAMCPKTEIRYKSVLSSVAEHKENTEKDHFIYGNVRFMISIPKKIGRDFDINITAANPSKETKNFQVWSYVYSGKDALMEKGKNKKELILSGNENRSFVLKNKVTEENIPLKDYRVMVKINASNRKTVRPFSKPAEFYPESLESAKEKQKRPKIKSFYTRARRYNEKIRLFAGCDTKNHTLILESLIGSDKKRCEGTTYFDVKIGEGANLFFLSLTGDNETYDTKKLLIVANDTGLQSFSENSKIYEIMNAQQKKEETGTESLITGQSVRKPVILYESSREKLKKLIKYLLPTLLLLISGIIYVGKNNE